MTHSFIAPFYLSASLLCPPCAPSAIESLSTMSNPLPRSRSFFSVPTELFSHIGPIISKNNIVRPSTASSIRHRLSIVKVWSPLQKNICSTHWFSNLLLASRLLLAASNELMNFLNLPDLTGRAPVDITAEILHAIDMWSIWPVG